MEPDKRRFVRKRTDQLLYAEFGPDNGSILLNLSEEGCSFQSMAPVREEQLRFSVSVGDGRKLESDGEMVWSDTAKKIGGLRFVNPSEELREQVREWLEATLVTADGKLDPAAVESKAKRRRKKLREEARAEAKLAWKHGTLKAPTKAEQTGETDLEAAKMSSAETAAAHAISLAWAEDGSASRLGYGNSARTWQGIGTIALAAMLLMALIAYRRELGHLVMSLGSSIAGVEQKGGAAAPVEAQPVPDNVSPDAKPVAMSDGRETPSENPAEAAPTSGEQLTGAADVPTGTAKRDLARQEGLVEDVPSLWTSVVNGNTRAEVTLASRYVRGDGVPQSCAQARVLLEAAVKRGSPEAKQKLGELGQAGCP
jgi:hypothetical protein